MSKKLKKTRWQSCNVLQADPEFRHLWSFGAGKNGFSLDQEASLPVDGSLPNRVAKDWKTLVQPKLNIALLPVEKVFLRVTQLPVSEFFETVSMVELQLEKLSPLPVTHIVWSVHVLPHTADNLQTVIVIIAPRDLVEEYLGKLEGQGFLADRLELPILDQLLATPITGDGAWIYPGSSSEAYIGLVAWWYGGVLRNLGLLHVPAIENAADLLKEQLTQMAWAGELEGWLTSEPHWHLVADQAMAASWQPLFRSWLGHAVEVIAPLSPTELVALTANRAARARPESNILPVEFRTRYHQQFVDRIWMRVVGSVLAGYGVIVVIYMVALQFQTMRANKLVTEKQGVYVQYTNTVRLKNQLQILQNRQALKYASLDCWKITADLLPTGFNVDNILFQDGKKFTVHGSAPADQGRQVVEFGDSLRKATVRGQPMFSKFESLGQAVRGASVQWGFTGELTQGEGGE